MASTKKTREREETAIRREFFLNSPCVAGNFDKIFEAYAEANEDNILHMTTNFSFKTENRSYY